MTLAQKLLRTPIGRTFLMWHATVKLLRMCSNLPPRTCYVQDLPPELGGFRSFVTGPNTAEKCKQRLEQIEEERRLTQQKAGG